MKPYRPNVYKVDGVGWTAPVGDPVVEWGWVVVRIALYLSILISLGVFWGCIIARLCH